MIKRSTVTGLLVGLALVLVSIYPLLTFYLDTSSLPIRRVGPLHTLLLILSGLAGLGILALIGSLAAWRNQVTDAGQGFGAGAISGFAAGIIFYVLLYAPTAAVLATRGLWAYEPIRQAVYPPNEPSFEYIRQMVVATYMGLVLCLLVGTLLGGIEGAIVGWRNRQEPLPRPLLLDVIASPRPRHLWFAGQDEAGKAGILAGLVGGGIIWLSITVAFLSNLTVEWPALEATIRENPDVVTRALFTDTLLVCLGPLFVLTVLGIGALAVLLLRDPPRRHLSRFQAVLIAGIAAAMIILLVVQQIAFFGIGMSRYLAAFVVFDARLVDPAGDYMVPGTEIHLNAQGLEWLRSFVHSPEMVTSLFYLLPVILFTIVLMLVLFWLAPQAAFYGLTLPMVFRRPVDRAARLARAIHSQPTSLLPRIYGLYVNDDQASQVLPHLTFLLKDQASAEVVSAYHMLSTVADDEGRATTIIRNTVARQEAWRWRAEVSELYRVLEEGLAAKTLAQITAIQAPPREVTSSLPVLLARSCEGIGQVLGELKKVERVDDLSTKLIFFNSAQAALLDLHRQVERESQESQTCESPFPEIAMVHSLLDRWQGFVMTATRELQGRADLRATLLAQRTDFGARVRQCVVVTNQGLNVAQNVHLSVADGEGYQVLEGAEQHVEILSPQESRELEFWLSPDGPRRLRLSWQLTFDDTVNTGRKVEFADAMDLMHEEEEEGGGGIAVRPFQRIFPIPYVTGTPLRSSEMFVGRQDVFEFVSEHLVGTYQNNVIVLHGQRRTGKTSILYRMQKLLAESHVAVLVDMQGKAARGTADFLYALSDDIVYALEYHGIQVDLPERAQYEKAPEFTFRSRFLRSVVNELDSRNLLLMFDEFEELQRRVEDGRLEPEIFPFLRNLMQHEARLDFVFSGTHKLEELGSEYWSILFNIAAYKRITFLDTDETYRLVTEPVAPYGMEYDPLALDRIIQVTAGHPYFTQVVCHEMVAYHNETERSYMTVTCVDQVLERIIERGEAHFKYIWAGATTGEKQVMLALADLLPNADAAATPTQMTEELDRKGYELSDADLLRAVARLQAKDILARSGPQSSLYRFRIDLIRRWIGTTRPGA